MNNIIVPESELQYPVPFSSSVLFPLLYLSLGFQRYAPRITSKIREEYDYIIVGAGPAGATLAARLSENPCVNILLLEAGKLPPRVSEIPVIAKTLVGSDLDWKYLTAPQERTGRLLNNRQMTFPLGKVVGGSGILNGMFYVRGSHRIYDLWAKYGAIGWSYKEILPYFKKMEKNTDLKSVDKDFHGTRGSVTVETPIFQSAYKDAIEQAIQELDYRKVDPNGKNQKGFYNYQTITRYGQRCSVAKAYLVPAENRTNLHIINNALVTKVLIDGNRVCGVEFKRNQTVFKIKASREVVLSAGAINTPQLLMLSGIGPRDHLEELGIPIIADLPVGKNFQDHAGSIHVYYTTRLPSLVSVLINSSTILEYITQRTGMFTTPDGMQYIAFLTNEKNTSSTAIPDYELYFDFATTSNMVLDMNIIPEVHQQVFQPYENYSQFFCISQHLKPKSYGTIKLKSSNPYDKPVVNPNYLDHPQDLMDIAEGLKKCDEIIKTSGFKSLDIKPIEKKLPGCESYPRFSDEYLKCEIESILLTLSHSVGTAKMGDPRDASTVVDPELRVKGIQGLRVVDASVMPIIPTGNTMIPTIMVAEKAADIMKKTISCNIRWYLYR